MKRNAQSHPRIYRTTVHERIVGEASSRITLQTAVVVAISLNLSFPAISQHQEITGKPYRIIDGKVDARTYNGYRRYHAVCNHCHGPDGMGSSFGPSLVDHPRDIETFRRVVRDGQSNGASVMKGFADDANVAPFVDDIYAYLQARADGVLSRGRPSGLGE
jgi:mono/diheme cytochrome c family protein